MNLGERLGGFRARFGGKQSQEAKDEAVGEQVNDPIQRAHQEMVSRAIKYFLREVTKGGYKLPERKIKSNVLVIEQNSNPEELEDSLLSSGNDFTMLIARTAQGYRLSQVAAFAMKDKHNFLLVSVEIPVERRMKFARARQVTPYGGIVIVNPDFVKQTIGLNHRGK